VVVTHGGHGTVLRALAADRPVLVLPHGRDQADNAVRVTTRGAGLSLRRTASPERIAQAVQALLDDPRYRDGAAALGSAIRHEVATSPLLDELEDLPAPCPAG
jgi:UDP:flavonoid glycosyltransferase YjiC (YdhE family)